MKPPMFSPPQGGSKPQQYLHRARMFRDAAIGLPDYVGPETNWPAYALMLHACELALKAFCDQSVMHGHPNARARNHDLQGWYTQALQYGLLPDPHVAEGISILAEIQASHYTRYPDNRGIQPRDLSITKDVVEALISATSLLVQGR